MWVFIIKRLFTLFITLAITSALIFLLMEILPGNAAHMLMGQDASEQALAAKQAELGLNDSAISRYFNWIVLLAQGQMGVSQTYGTPVADLILERMTLTAPLAIISMIITAFIAFFAGIISATHHKKPLDIITSTFMQIGIAMPSFWLAIILILIFSIHFEIFPAGGFDGWGDYSFNAILTGLKSLILPATALSAVQAAILTKFTRTSMLEVLHENFIKTARAKGLSNTKILFKHVVRNALIPVITIMGIQFSELLAGTIVIENVFYLSGIGQLIFQGINNRDLAIVSNCVLVLAGMIIVMNFIIDILYAIIDPRVKVIK